MIEDCCAGSSRRRTRPRSHSSTTCRTAPGSRSPRSCRTSPPTPARRSARGREAPAEAAGEPAARLPRTAPSSSCNETGTCFAHALACESHVEDHPGQEVPNRLDNELRRRAKARGQSLTAYVQEILEPEWQPQSPGRLRSHRGTWAARQGRFRRRDDHPRRAPRSRPGVATALVVDASAIGRYVLFARDRSRRTISTSPRCAISSSLRRFDDSSVEGF